MIVMPSFVAQTEDSKFLVEVSPCSQRASAVKDMGMRCIIMNTRLVVMGATCVAEQANNVCG